MIIGYARVSKDEQNLDRQINQLNDYGVEKIIHEKYTGTKKQRPGIDQLLQTIRPKDTVVVESISRLGRNTLDILLFIQQLDHDKIAFISLKENIDTSTSTGKAMLQMMSVIAELERNLLAERVKEGIAASRRRGTAIGRPKVERSKLNMAMRLYNSGDYSVKEITEASKISQGTLYRELNKIKLQKLNAATLLSTKE
ncbi:recombinase family protein [Brochothrix thermosphacta]|uniref:Putative DNA-invertase (Site specific recombinase) from prophage, Pin n=1 Tax=Brochothrix thermosphacta TaxID=2756 RepID=A0A1D2KRC7_BROTH|nr:recombinase family protein [Brochothrix thermosphacta]ATF27093.1 resolvase [Brochothrix thermosphacta]ATH86452.1 resolvase [Brochothrix thermosphacta]MPQ28030.1 recombinase family protein [Brochothrix thermosphacta]ODJ47768.1 resolvase [Brochothrix thermosphacta]ODJ57141.1 resolvase [Brochothrix thermosphacta]